MRKITVEHNIVCIYSIARDAVSTEQGSNKCSFTSDKPSGQVVAPDSKYCSVSRQYPLWYFRVVNRKCDLLQKINTNAFPFNG